MFTRTKTNKHMCSRLSCHIRTLRKRACLTRKELARLLGLSKSQIVRLENGRSKPSARVLLACIVLFGDSLPILFTQLYNEIEAAVLRNLARLHDQLEDSESQEAERKRTFVRAALDRSITRTDSPKT